MGNLTFPCCVKSLLEVNQAVDLIPGQNQAMQDAALTDAAVNFILVPRGFRGNYVDFSGTLAGGNGAGVLTFQVRVNNSVVGDVDIANDSTDPVRIEVNTPLHPGDKIKVVCLVPAGLTTGARVTGALQFGTRSNGLLVPFFS